MEVDAELAVSAASEAHSEVGDDHLLGGVGEDLVAHHDGVVCAGDDACSLELHARPRIQGEAGIFGEIGVSPDEVGQGTLKGASEHDLGSQGRLEKDGAGSVAIVLLENLLGDGNIVLVLGFGGSDRNQTSSPPIQGGQDLFFTNWLR